MTRTYDVAIIGAGPAGMAAAVEASVAGLSVVVFDEQFAPGGQIYRGVETASEVRHSILGRDYSRGRQLTQSFRASPAHYFPGTLVWNIRSDKLLEFSQNGQSDKIHADRLIIASGALERPCPLPGWTLPGVTTAGALQILLKSAGIVQEAAVLAGSGPLLWLVAAQMVDAGCPPKAIIENLPRGRTMAALPHLFKALRAREYLFKGVTLMRKVRRSGVPVYSQASNLCIEGDLAVSAVTFTCKGRQHKISAKCVALHQGVVPNQQITRLLECKHFWDKSQHCFRPELNSNFETTVPGVYMIGDGAGIAGAKAAELQGRIVGLTIAADKVPVSLKRIKSLKGELSREASIRPFLEAYYAPSPDILQPADETIVCRCEEITAGKIRSSASLGAQRPNEVKSLFRTGMGPCQGRVCGLAVMDIIAKQRQAEPQDVGYYRIRPPLKPIPLKELANYGKNKDVTRGEPV
ncbi:NAD(P)/FAD-dependent oxidoreductase [Pantoea sp. YR343]|uniref:FAD/NAD(P)-dependent oxidoreductase n=1 Tax=Pantoea sp. YR343 TaxID=1144341 RepID=UPI000271150E|nr:NAD(P)/FAD-dependent oxidoreductase [Pantoea sp. YR343]KAJ9431808.1 NAD(P)/FAD-dependent oxidoreductase [Pantoea sp. YR343]